MRMNDFDGKAFLASVRGGQDYAHAGEAESIELVMRGLTADAERQVLDAGCGRGGTADYVAKQGWGHVVGVDIEGQSIEYAKQRYRDCEFYVCDLEQVGDKFPERFDMIYIFNALYAVPSKPRALKSLRAAAKTGCEFRLFDYTLYDENFVLPEVMLSDVPILVDRIESIFSEAGWKVEKNQVLDDSYARWYREFLARFDSKALQDNYPQEHIAVVRKKYSDLLHCIESGVMGGALVIARAI